MRSVSAIAIDLPEGSTKPGEFSDLLARLEQILDDASGGRDGQPRLVPMRVVITFGSPALNAPSHSIDREAFAMDAPLLADQAAPMPPDALDHFPPEQLERPSPKPHSRKSCTNVTSPPVIFAPQPIDAYGPVRLR